MPDTKATQPGDIHAAINPTHATADAHLVFIGRATTPWRPGDCPKNMAQARAIGRPATLVIDAAWRPALADLERASHIIILGWFAAADRTLIALRPTHLQHSVGCFALRSPARPNPIGVSIARLINVDVALGTVEIDALDWYDGTAVLDIKPYYPSTDAIATASIIEP